MQLLFRRRLLRALTRLDAFAQSPTRPLINVVGVFRSGTNLMKAMLEENFHTKVVFSKWHWKHSILPMRPDQQMIFTPPVPMVVVYKRPDAFNVSLYQYWKKTRAYLMPKNQTLSEFVRAELIVHDDTFQSRAPHYLFQTPTDYWNQFHYPYLNWQENQSNIHFVFYDDLIGNPHQTLLALQKSLRIRRKTTGVMQLPRQQVTPSSDSEKSGFGASVQKGAPLVTLSARDEAFIQNRIHPAVNFALLAGKTHPVTSKRDDVSEAGPEPTPLPGARESAVMLDE